MDSNKISSWLQVGSNLGLLVGLVLVALQINQNSELGRLNFYTQEIDAYVSIGAMPAGDDLARAMANAVDDPESLTTTEMIQLDGYLQNVVTQLNRRDYLYEVGVFQNPIELNFTRIRWAFGNKFALAWWDERRTSWARDRVREFLDQELPKIADADQVLVFGNIRKALAAE